MNQRPKRREIFATEIGDDSSKPLSKARKLGREAKEEYIHRCSRSSGRGEVFYYVMPKSYRERHSSHRDAIFEDNSRNS